MWDDGDVTLGEQRAFLAGAESAAQTVEAVARVWQDEPYAKAAVDKFAEMVARAVRESADAMVRPRSCGVRTSHRMHGDCLGVLAHEEREVQF